MATAWTFEGDTARLGGPLETVTLVEETTFCLSDRCGDVRPGGSHGLLFLDTRFLSALELCIAGTAPEPLGCSIEDPFRATFVSRVQRPGAIDDQLLVTRDRRVGRGMVETIKVENFSRETARFDITVRVGADFADLFDVKEQRPTSSRVTRVTSDAAMVRFDGVRSGMACWMQLDSIPGGDVRLMWGGPVLRWPVELRVGQAFEVCLEITVGVWDEAVSPRHQCGAAAEDSGPARRLGSWRTSTPRLQASDDRLELAVHRGSEDLGALRLVDPDHPDDTSVAAGAPWFMTLFGRDALLASYMALPLDPTLALGTLRTLARLQGVRDDPVTEEQPGRIMHEIRFVRQASWRFRDGDRYYGSIDATPLFVVVLGELRRWGIAAEAVDALLPAADAALAWIADYGDRDGDGFVEYQRATPGGLANQGWKDSWDAVRFADGRLAEPPIALAEVQGYTYSALRARAYFADEAGDVNLRDRLRRRADDLRGAFNDRFFLPDRGWFAMALDGHKQPVDALTSNIGHCLWSGIIEPELARLVADRLLSEDLFSGWGIRTLATSSGGYNPIGYHTGSVWPHDNALIVAGLVRYGLVDHARRVVDGLLEVSMHYGGRLPELLAGLDRSRLGVPAIYPTSCMPQAWAAATPLLLLRSLLRLDPQAPHSEIWAAPMLRDDEEIHLQGVPFAGARLDIDAIGADIEVRGIPAGISLHRRPRSPV